MKNDYLVKMQDYVALEKENNELKKELKNKEFLLLSQGKELKTLWGTINKIEEYINSCDYISKAILEEILEGDNNE